MVKTSVIIPVYNTAEYLKECIDSVFAQTQKQIEVIAINDGSTDNSLAVLIELKQIYPQLIIISQKNQGQGHARNVGVDIAQGEYVYFIDSDDYLEKDALEKCYDISQKNELDILMFDAQIFGNTNLFNTNPYDRSKIIKQWEILTGIEFMNTYYEKTYHPSPCLIYLKKRFLEDNKIKFLSKVFYEDNEFYCRIMNVANRVMYISECLYMRRYRDNSVTTSDFDLRRARDFGVVIEGIGKIEVNTENMVFRKIAVKLLGDVVNRCRTNNLFDKNQKLAERLREIAVNLCFFNYMEYFFIDYLYRICKALPQEVVSEQLWCEIDHNRDIQFRKTFATIPLNQESTLVGIYGTGKYTDRFIEDYVRCFGEIKADYIFIDSHIETKTKQYMTKDIYNIKDVGSLPLEHIIVSSNRYEEEMSKTIMDIYGEKYCVYYLKSDYHF